MTTADSPVNVSGISIDAVPNVAAAVTVTTVGNGSPNLFDPLVQRAHDWSNPGPSVDDASVLESLPLPTASELLLMTTDIQGTPSIVGKVSPRDIFSYFNDDNIGVGRYTLKIYGNVLR